MALLKYNGQLLKFNGNLLKHEDTEPPTPELGYYRLSGTTTQVPFGMDADFISGTEFSRPTDYEDIIELKLPEGVITCADNALAGYSALLYLELPSTLTNTGANFLNTSTGLINMTIRSQTTPIVIDSLGASLPTVVRGVFVKDSMVNTYKSAPIWSNFTDIIVGYGEKTGYYILNGETEQIPIDLGWRDVVYQFGYIGLEQMDIRHSIKELRVPDGVQTLTLECLADSTLVKFISPSSCNKWGERVLLNSYNLQEVIVEAIEPPIIASEVFANCSELTTIKVPAQSVNSYKADPNWGIYTDKIIAI